MRNTILVGDVRETLRGVPDGVAQCCVTSPPYWGLRDYGDEAQIGLEQTPEEYVAEMVEVFREVRRVLRDDGTCWVNLGDSYASSGGQSAPHRDSSGGIGKKGTRGTQPYHSAGGGFERPSSIAGTVKPKDLVGIPWRVAFALQADGWYLRQDIIWHKPNPMPESVTDRCTKSHEYVFLLSKQERYFYDAEAVKEEFADERQGNPGRYKWKQGAGDVAGGGPNSLHRGDGIVEGWNQDGKATGRNRRSVWTITTKPYSGAHFAVMPPDLVEPCILAGTSERGCCPACGKPWERVVEADKYESRGKYRKHAGESGHNNPTGKTPGSNTRGMPDRHKRTTGWRPGCTCGGEPIPCLVLDPFGGSGTTAIVAEGHGRDWLLCELNPTYVDECAWPRIRQGWNPETRRARPAIDDRQRRLFEG